jgi:hypothetical protein
MISGCAAPSVGRCSTGEPTTLVGVSVDLPRAAPSEQDTDPAAVKGLLGLADTVAHDARAPVRGFLMVPPDVRVEPMPGTALATLHGPQ